MFANILIAYDGSDHARKAARIASDLAHQQDPAAVLWIVTVMPGSPWEMGEPFFSQFIESRTLAGQTMIKDASDLIGEGFEIHTELLFGNPAESIIQVAETRACDLIVMGTRGLSLLQGLLLGSQAQKVISLAHCPVLVVK
jgi:nucleotide-binding universal stress UspA family protein